MAFLGAAARAGLAAVGSSGKPGRRRRRPRPISGRPTRRVTDPTSRAAIRRSEARRRGRVSSRPTSRGPVRGRTTRSVNIGSSRRRSPMRKGRCK